MGWQALVIRIGGTLVGLTLLCVLFWSLSRWSRRHQIRQLETHLVEHLRGIGVDAEEQKSKGTVTRTHDDDYALILRHLVTIRVWLRGIESIEIWRITRKGNKESPTLDEMTFVITPEPGMSLNRIPILTNIAKTHITEGKNGFEWRGFEWGRLPLLVDRLKVDADLNNRLLGYFNTDLPDNLRITVLSGDRIGITTSYSPQRLPSRSFLVCIEDIADHIRDYVAERNRTRELQNSR
jgi:hypothetical protein